MKYKNTALLLLSGAALLFTGCKEDFLDVDHYSVLPGNYMFRSEDNVNAGLIGCYDPFYPDKKNSQGIGDCFMWGFKPNFEVANFFTLDVNNGVGNGNFFELYNPNHGDLRPIWGYQYEGVTRCNNFLVGIDKMDASLFKNGETAKKRLIAEAKAMRGMYYYGLVKHFGRVPLLLEGDTYSATPHKARCEKIEDAWGQIVKDSEEAAAVLDWTPYNNEYGRVTKGSALAYAAKAYMNMGDYDKAKSIYKQIIESNTYELLPCFSYLYDTDKGWTKEDIWCVAMYTDDGPNKGSASGWDPTEDHYIYTPYTTAGQEFGGWGSLHISWECYYSFEPGDRRRQYSMVALGETNPFTKQTIGSSWANKVKTGASCAPNIYSLKFWRERADYAPDHLNQPLALRHFRYAEALLDYAECCFRTGDEPTGWKYIGIIRDRAWGNKEVGLNNPDYPFELLDAQVNVPDAKTYYTRYAAEKGYSAEVWNVAVAMERRHEFNAEFSLFYDLRRQGILPEFIEREYPKGVGVPNTDPTSKDNWHFYRTFDFLPDRMWFPIPQKEIETNDLITEADQNPGY